jgi:hypothetical protein
MLINLSNHPSSKWDEAQQKAAASFGKILDISFPSIPPEWDTDQVEILARKYLEQIKAIDLESTERPVVHIAGELVFCYLLIQLLLKEQFLCVTSTTERIVKEEKNVKTTRFEFIKFRAFKIK